VLEGESSSTATLTDNGGRALDLNALHHPGQRDTVPDKERVNVRALVSRVGSVNPYNEDSKEQCQ
jgi:hypothetical protein